jgi:hypothetical protein
LSHSPHERLVDGSDVEVKGIWNVNGPGKVSSQNRNQVEGRCAAQFLGMGSRLNELTLE